MACDISIIEVVTAGPRGASGTGSLPIGGDTNDVLTKNSAADSDASFKAPNRDALTFGGLPPSAYLSSSDFNTALASVTNPTAHLPFTNTIAVLQGVGRMLFHRATIARYTDFYGNPFEIANAGDPVFERNGIKFEKGTTNLFLESAVGVTQAVDTIIGEVYTVSINEGNGVLSLTGIEAYPDVTLGNPATFTADHTTLSLGVTGTCNKVMVERGDLATSYVETELIPFSRDRAYCEFTAYANIMATREMTIVFDVISEQMIRPEDAELFFLEIGTPGNEIQLSLTGVGPTMVFHPGTNATTPVILSPNPFPANVNGCRICITVSPSYINAYSNGILFHTSSNPALVDMNLATTDMITFGGRNDTTSLTGHLKNMKFYGKELTPFEARMA